MCTVSQTAFIVNRRSDRGADVIGDVEFKLLIAATKLTSQQLNIYLLSCSRDSS